MRWIVLCAAAGMGFAAHRATPSNPCHVNGVAEEVRCLSVRVPETPGDPATRYINIHAVVLPARGALPHREPLVLIQGGPGVPGTRMAIGFASLDVLRDRRDLVFFDQRGSGNSNPLNCASLGRFNFLGALFPRTHISACRRSVEGRANLAAYTNTTSVEDLEAIRKALGAERWSLVGYSFGTRLAQMYAKRYPARVRSVVLDGVVPFDVVLTADLAVSMERSLTIVTDRCQDDRECATRFPGTKRALSLLSARLDSAPVRVRVPLNGGQTLEGRFGPWELAYAVRGMLYGPLAASIPVWVNHAMRTGDFSNFARLYWQRSRWVGDETSVPLHLGIYCSEDLPFADSLDAVRRSNGTFTGARYYQEYRNACAGWPMPRAARDVREPWRSDIPTLLLSGERDPVTPPEYGERVARNLSHSRHIVTPLAGHAEGSDCKNELIARFLLEGLRALSPGNCLERPRFPAFTLN